MRTLSLNMCVCVCVLLVGGCFDPTFPSGIACGENGACPPGTMCNLITDTCEAPADAAAAQADAAPGPDGPPGIDATPADAAACTMFSATHFDPCALPAPMPLTITGGIVNYDTDTGLFSNGLTAPSVVVDGYRIISATDVDVQSTGLLRPKGSLPLIIAASGTIAIEGGIDVSSANGASSPERIGSGAHPSACGTSTGGTGGDSVDGGGGGGGGGFGSAGGNGGLGAEQDVQGAPGTGGVAVVLPSVVRGGCRGGDGGVGDLAGSIGAGGNGGGAIQLTAAGSIAISGTLRAGGSGGYEADDDCGGGGGGSGGYIGLEAPAINVSASGRLVATGGAGSSGARDTNGGAPGEDGQLDGDPAIGGDAPVDAGDGGDGGVNGTSGLTGQTGSHGGGGGGGGGVGFILVWSAAYSVDGLATINPPVIKP